MALLTANKSRLEYGRNISDCCSASFCMNPTAAKELPCIVDEAFLKFGSPSSSAGKGKSLLVVVSRTTFPYEVVTAIAGIIITIIIGFVIAIAFSCGSRGGCGYSSYVVADIVSWIHCWAPPQHHRRPVAAGSHARAPTHLHFLCQWLVIQSSSLSLPMCISTSSPLDPVNPGLQVAGVVVVLLTTVCIGCEVCCIGCKHWHPLVFSGTHWNPL